MINDVADFSQLPQKHVEVYRELLNVQHTLEKSRPGTESVARLLKKRGYELLSKYEEIPFKVKEEMQRISPLDARGIRIKLESL